MVTSAAQPAVVISIADEPITAITEDYIKSAMNEATEMKAACLIIKLDTPGGVLSATRSIVQEMLNSSVPTIVYVSPSGARAGSAGVFITLAANFAAMAPSTNIGAAHPVLAGGSKADDKITNDTKAWARTIAEKRDRNIRWAESAVTKSSSITEKEALRLNVIDAVVADMDELLALLEQKGIIQKDATVKEIEPGIKRKILGIVAHPEIAYILMLLGIYGLIFEFTHPGFGFPGIAGVISLMLSFMGLRVLPINYAGLIFVILGIAFLIAEVFMSGFGLFAVGSGVSFLIGGLILFPSPQEFLSISLPFAIAIGASTIAIGLLLALLIFPLFRKKAVTGSEGMVGLRGDVKMWSGNSGKVFVHGEIWNAVSADSLNIGDKIKVVKVNHMELEVKKCRF